MTKLKVGLVRNC